MSSRGLGSADIVVGSGMDHGILGLSALLPRGIETAGIPRERASPPEALPDGTLDLPCVRDSGSFEPHAYRIIPKELTVAGLSSRKQGVAILPRAQRLTPRRTSPEIEELLGKAEAPPILQDRENRCAPFPFLDRWKTFANNGSLRSADRRDFSKVFPRVRIHPPCNG